MPHPLTEHIAEVRHAARRVAGLRALGQLVATTLVTGMLVALIDYGLRWEDLGTRILLTLIWLGIVVAASFHWIRPLLRISWSDQSLALMIERRFPQLDDKLSSSVAFLTQSQVYGSKPLMRNVIAETTELAGSLSFRDAIDSRPGWRAMGWLSATLAICASLFLAAPQTSRQAVTRLLVPWQDNAWPRLHHLKFVNPPARVARGSDLRLALIDEKSRLPNRVDIQLWQEGAPESQVATRPMQRIDERMVLELTNVRRSFKYRAAGGDDLHMPWQEVVVVEPPTLVSGRIKLTPPAYTGWQTHTIDQPLLGFRGLAGTDVLMTGNTDRPLMSGQLTLHGSELETSFPLEISEDGRSYTVPRRPGDGSDARRWILEEACEYTLTLTDRDGTKTVDPDRWRIRMVADEPPTLALIEPDTELLIAPRAIVPILCDVEDDLAVKRVELRYLRTDQSDEGEVGVTLYEGVDTLPAIPMPETLPPESDKRRIEFNWIVESLQLPPGAVLSFTILAEDYKGQSSQTLARRLAVVTENDLIDRIGRRQSLVLSRLQQRLKQQRQAKQHIDAVGLQLAETQLMDKPAMDRLQSALLAQRQVNAALHGDDAEVLKELRQLRKLLDRSRIGEVEIRSRVEATLASLKELGDLHLEPAMLVGSRAKDALQAIRDQGQDDTLPEDVPQALRSVAEHQAASIQWLENLLDEMSAWDNYRRFAQGFSDLLRQQQDVQQATQQVAKEALSRSQSELDGSLRAALRGAMTRQLDLAGRMDRMLENLGKATDVLSSTDPQAADMVRAAMQVARHRAVSGTMRQAGRQIGEQRLGLAVRQQQTAEQALEEMLEELSRRSYSPAETAEKLTEADRQLQRLRKRQAELSRDFQRANREPDAGEKRRELQRLAKRQQQLAEQTHTLERQLQRLRADDSSQQTSQAAKSMEQAAAAAEAGDAQQARERSQLAEAQMEQAQQSLQQQHERAKSELAQEQLVRLPQLVDALIARQESLVHEIQRLAQLLADHGQLTAGQLASTQMAAEAQRAVAQDAGLVANQLSQLPAFVFALNEIRNTMEQVAQRLDSLETSPPTQTVSLANRAWEELRLVRQMMHDEPPSKAPEHQDGAGGTAGEEQGSPNNSQDFEPRVAQLRLLRAMQISINQETEQLHPMLPADAGADPELERRVQRLAARQGSLAKLVTDMLSSGSDVQEPKPTQQELPSLDALDQELDRLLQ